jgi:hypothetical protein
VARVGAVYSAFAGGGKPQSTRFSISDRLISRIAYGAFPLPALPRVTGEARVLGGLIVLLGVILTRVALDRAARVPV